MAKKGEKKFSLVLFTDEDTLHVVSDNWLFNDCKGEQMCYWPRKHQLSLCIKRQEPSSKNWRRHPAKVKHTYASLRAAIADYEHYTEQSDETSSEEEEASASKRSRRDGPSNSQGTGTFATKSAAKQGTLGICQTSTPQENNFNFNSEPLPMSIPNIKQEVMEMSSFSTPHENGNQPSDVQTSLNTILSNQNHIISMLSCLEGTQNTTKSAQIDDIDLGLLQQDNFFHEPISTIQELESFDKKLEEDESYRSGFITYLFVASHHAKKIRTAARKMLSSIATPMVWLNFSLVGQQRKMKRGDKIVDMTKRPIVSLQCFECMKFVMTSKNVNLDDFTNEVSQILRALNKLKGAQSTAGQPGETMNQSEVSNQSLELSNHSGDEVTSELD